MTVKEITEWLLEESSVDQTEVNIYDSHNQLTRFANNYIHQNVEQFDRMVYLRLVLDGKVAVVSNNIADTDTQESLQKLLTSGEELVKLQTKDKYFKSLPTPTKITKRPVVFDATKNSLASARADNVSVIIEQAKKNKLHSAGMISADVMKRVTANSLGVFAEEETTNAACEVTMMGTSSSGYASSYSADIANISCRSVADKAVRKAVDSVEVEEIKPGEYEVILEPSAVADILSYMAYSGFNGLMFQEGTSFLSDNIDKKILSEKITIIDDSLDERCLMTTFDGEGYAKKPLVLIDAGVARNVVYDSYTASKFGVQNTGHAWQAPNTYGPMPDNLILQAGKQTRDEMIKNVKRGVLITRFWYTNVLQEKTLRLTGMTRDGTFYIENGEIKHAIKNMRFTGEMVDAFSDVRGVGDDLVLASTTFGSVFLVPSLHLGRFTFNGVTR